MRLEIKRHGICGFVLTHAVNCQRYGMNSQVSFIGISLFCPPKRITWPNAGKLTMPAPSRGGGDCVVRNCFHPARGANHRHVVFWSMPPLPPPKRITALIRGSKAAEAAYTSGG